MATQLFLMACLLGALALGLFAGRSGRRWVPLAALTLAAALPALLWLGFSIRDAILFDHPVFDRASESGRFGFYVGGMLALWATPGWFLAALTGLWVGRRSAR